MLERPSDNHGNENFSSNARSLFLTQRMALSDQQARHDTSKHADKVFNRDEARFLDVERDEATSLHDNQSQVISTQPGTSNSHQDQQATSPPATTRLVDLQAIRENLHLILQSKTMPSASPSRKRMQITPTPSSSIDLLTNSQGPTTPSKIPVRSTKPTLSRSPTLSSSHRQNRSNTPSRIPVASPTLSKGAFQFFTPRNEAGAPSINAQQQRLTTSEEDSETDQLKDEELKTKLKEEKRHGKKTGELLHQLHENYKDLLEKYAQAENTIDQLRFQPKMTGDNTPTSNVSGSILHVVPPTKLNVATLRSSGVYHSTTVTPLSSIRPVTSTTTTTTTPIVKSTSPANSGTVESVVFDRTAVQQDPILSQGDLLKQSKVFGDKMKSFLTLMDANQLSLAEQKQVYESIKQDYERLLHAFNQAKSTDDTDAQTTLNSELNNMKQLLKEIVKQITQNLLDKSMNSSRTERQSRLRRDESHSSQLSVRSSLYNHDDLMDQYQKILTAVNTRHTDIEDQRDSIVQRYEVDRRETQELNSSPEMSHGNLSPPIKNSRKPCVYVSGDSDNDQQAESDNGTPIPFAQGLESISFEMESLNSPAIQQINEQQAHIHGMTRPIKKRDSLQPSNDHVEPAKKERKTITNRAEDQEAARPLARNHYSMGSLRTQTNDYDSGIGTTNLTKLSRESRDKELKSSSSRVYTSTVDESHCQSLEVEQESISSTASSRSSASGSASLTRFDVPSNSLNDYYHYYRRKLRDPLADKDRSRMDDRRVTGAYDSLVPNSSHDGKVHRSYHTWRPQGSASSDRSRVKPVHRNASIRSSEREQSNYKPSRPVTAPQISPRRPVKSRPISYTYPNTIYRSSLYINPGQKHQPSPSVVINSPNSLFLDPRTGTVYRYQSNSPRTRQVSSTSSQGQYHCATCGSITTYYHRHSSASPVIRPSRTRYDDPGYESEERSTHRSSRHADPSSPSSSSDSDSDVKGDHLQMLALKDAYDRAEQIEHSSRILSNSIRRQLKLIFATMSSNYPTD